MVELFEEIVRRKRKLLSEQLEIIEAKEKDKNSMFPAMRSTGHLILETKLKLIDELIEDVEAVRSIISVKDNLVKDCESCSVSGSNEQCDECHGSGIV